MAYSEDLQYLGSYFTMNVMMIAHIIISANNKYLGIIWENNDIDVVNLYDQ